MLDSVSGSSCYNLAQRLELWCTELNVQISQIRPTLLQVNKANVCTQRLQQRFLFIFVTLDVFTFLNFYFISLHPVP